jgi:hypothetical protein
MNTVPWFSLVALAAVETESYAGDSAGRADEGDRVDVLYDPADPARARIAAPAAIEIGTAALSGRGRRAVRALRPARADRQLT